MMSKLTKKEKKLFEILEKTHEKYHKKDYLGSDPIEFLHCKREEGWSDRDLEAFGLLCAMLSYGNVVQIRRSISLFLEIFSSLNMTLSDYIGTLQNPKNLVSSMSRFLSFVHRFNKGQDLLLLFFLMGWSREQFGSLEKHFLAHGKESEKWEDALEKVLSDWERVLLTNESLQPYLETSIYFFLTKPSRGSTCKRWCMFLRWMIRNDEIDLGIWKESQMYLSELYYPVDTHIAQIMKLLGVTKRKGVNWKFTKEITQELKKLSPDDPLKYDFSLTRVGILKKNDFSLI